MKGLSWRLSMRGSPMRKQMWSCPECAKAYEWEWPNVSVSIAPEGGASSHAAPSAHAIEGGLLAGHPASGGEWSSPPAAVVGELQAEIQKLKGKAAELMAELDELKVRDRQRDEDFEKLKQDIIWVMEEVIAPRPPQVDIRALDPGQGNEGFAARKTSEVADLEAWERARVRRAAEVADLEALEFEVADGGRGAGGSSSSCPGCGARRCRNGSERAESVGNERVKTASRSQTCAARANRHVTKAAGLVSTPRGDQPLAGNRRFNSIDPSDSQQ